MSKLFADKNRIVNRPISNSISKERVYLISGILILIIIGIKWSLGLNRHMDILFGDEAEYIRNGVDLFHTIRNDWGPAYNIWYKFLSLFSSDAIRLYYANYIIGGILVSVLLFIALYSHRIHPGIALYISFCFFVSSININTWPRISHFVLILILLSLIILSRLHSNAKKSIVFAIFCYICSYARPELFISFVIILIISCYFIYQERKNFKYLLPYLITLTILLLFFQITFGFPSSTYKSGLNRLYSAFCQHYTINYKFRTGAHFDAITEWIEFCKTKFPDCFTILDVMKKHPVAFFHHVLFNLKNYSLLLFLTVCSFIIPTGIFHSKKVLIATCIILLSCILFVILKKESRCQFIQLIKKHQFKLIFLFIFGVPSIGMCAVIFPRAHYILLHSIFIVFLLAILFQSILQNFTLCYWQFMAFCVLLLLISPRSRDYQYTQFGKDMDNLCEQKLIRYFESKKENKYVVFTNYLNITYILPKNYSEFSTEFELRKGMDFGKILSEKKINVILVSINILQNPVLTKDSTWNNLISQPERYNFKKVNYSDICESYLLIKE